MCCLYGGLTMDGEERKLHGGPKYKGLLSGLENSVSLRACLQLLDPLVQGNRKRLPPILNKSQFSNCSRRSKIVRELIKTCVNAWGMRKKKKAHLLAVAEGTFRKRRESGALGIRSSGK